MCPAKEGFMYPVSQSKSLLTMRHKKALHFWKALNMICMTKIQTKHAQIKTIFHFLQKNIATASMVSEATGIPQKNICRYKRDLEKSGLLAEVRKGICELTKFKAYFITCDKSKFPSKRQLNLFK